MKTCLETPTYHYIDTAPLAAGYEIIITSIMAFIEAGRMGDMLRCSHKVVRLVRVFTKLETQNALLKRKLEMLSHKFWRARVLKELGGLRKLKLWEAAQKRIMARLEERAQNPAAPALATEPSWLYTDECIAESERLKAHKRICGRATAHPRVFRDRCRMDFDGQFRLAPLLRYEQGARQIKVYTQNTITDYEWNNIPLAKVKGMGPAMVWPMEFYAAAAIEDEMMEARTSRCFESIPTIPLHKALSPKVRYDLFGSLTR